MSNETIAKVDERHTDRNATIAAIKAALKKRSGKTWSVTGGRGTAWGWINISAPPARRTWRYRLRTGMPDYPENYEGYNGADGGHGITPEDRKELATLLAIEQVHDDGVSVPADYKYRREYIDRAEGRTPTMIGVPYWD